MVKTRVCFLKQCNYCANPKTVNTAIIFGMLLCCEVKGNQMQDGKTARCNGFLALWLAVFSCGLISHLIGHCTIKMSKSNQSVHGFWIRTVNWAGLFKSRLTLIWG